MRLRLLTRRSALLCCLALCAAPHPKHAKESACGCAGLFSAPVALPLYAHAFEQAGALQHLEAFASFNGPDFYGLPRNTGERTLACTAACMSWCPGVPTACPDRSTGCRHARCLAPSQLLSCSLSCCRQGDPAAAALDGARELRFW